MAFEICVAGLYSFVAALNQNSLKCAMNGSCSIHVPTVCSNTLCGVQTADIHHRDQLFRGQHAGSFHLPRAPVQYHASGSLPGLMSGSLELDDSQQSNEDMREALEYLQDDEAPSAYAAQAKRGCLRINIRASASTSSSRLQLIRHLVKKANARCGSILGFSITVSFSGRSVNIVKPRGHARCITRWKG